jgi:outer membrane protein assembly factor BamB
VSLLLAIAPLWLMLAAANTSAHAQTSDDVSNSSTTSSPADWTQFLRDNMQRWNPYETVLGVGNVGKLGLKWSSPYSISSESPAVANGVVYFGSYDGNVYALDASTGAKLWSYGPIGGGGPSSSPAVANGVVYIGSFSGNVDALDASTGALLWSFPTEDMMSSSPTVVNGVVYIGSYDGNLYALNDSTGAKLWSFGTSGTVYGAAAVVNGVVYFIADEATADVYALNASTGAKLWSYTTGDSMAFSPAVANGVVYLDTINFTTVSGALYALNASTGAKLWSYVTGPAYEAPAVANGIVYVTGGEDFNVYALNASTGAKLWSYPSQYGGASPAVANGVVYVGLTYGSMYALNASTGAELWSYIQSNVSFSAPVVVNGTLYVGAGSQTYAFELGGATADLFLRIWPTPETVQQGDSLTYAFPVWNLGPNNAYLEVLNAQVPAGTTFDHIRISGTPGLGTCTTPPYGGTGQIVCNENSAMAPNTTWTVRLTVKVTAPSGTVITENAATLADTPDPNLANNTASVSTTVQ